VDGKIVSERDPGAVTRDQLAGEMRKRVGDQMQTPPMVSPPSRKTACPSTNWPKGRDGRTGAPLIHVYRFDLLDFTPPCASFELKCTKGTYVRTLCADIGEALGCGGHLKELRRTRIGSLSVENALGLDTLMSMELADLEKAIVPMHQFRIQDMDA
jgi:tRNA pseudouridine55 synthase